MSDLIREDSGTPSDQGYNSLSLHEFCDSESRRTADAAHLYELDDDQYSEFDSPRHSDESTSELNTPHLQKRTNLPSQLLVAHKELALLRQKLVKYEDNEQNYIQKILLLANENAQLKNACFDLEKKNKQLNISLKILETDLNMKTASINCLKQTVVEQNCEIQSVNHEKINNQCTVATIRKELELQNKSNKFYLEQILKLQESKVNLDRKLIEYQTKTLTKNNQIKKLNIENISLKQKLNSPSKTDAFKSVSPIGLIEWRSDVKPTRDKSENDVPSKSCKKYKITLTQRLKEEIHTLKKLLNEHKKQIRKCQSTNKCFQVQLHSKDQILNDRNMLFSTLEKSYLNLTEKYKSAIEKVERLETKCSELKARCNELQLKLNASNEEKNHINTAVNNLKLDLNKLVLKLAAQDRKPETGESRPKPNISRSEEFGTAFTEDELNEFALKNGIKHKNLHLLLSKLLEILVHFDRDAPNIENVKVYCLSNVTVKEILENAVEAHADSSEIQTQTFNSELVRSKELLGEKQKLKSVLEYYKQLFESKYKWLKTKSLKILLKRFKRYKWQKYAYRRKASVLDNLNKNLKNNETNLIVRIIDLEKVKLNYENNFIDIAKFISNLSERDQLLVDKTTVSNQLALCKPFECQFTIDYFENKLLTLFQNILKKMTSLRNYINILQIELNSIKEQKSNHEKCNAQLKIALENTIKHNKILLQQLMQEFEKRHNFYLTVQETFKNEETPMFQVEMESCKELKSIIETIKVDISHIQYKLKFV